MKKTFKWFNEELFDGIANNKSAEDGGDGDDGDEDNSSHKDALTKAMKNYKLADEEDDEDENNISSVHTPSAPTNIPASIFVSRTTVAPNASQSTVNPPAPRGSDVGTEAAKLQAPAKASTKKATKATPATEKHKTCVTLAQKGAGN